MFDPSFRLDTKPKLKMVLPPAWYWGQRYENGKSPLKRVVYCQRNGIRRLPWGFDIVNDKLMPYGETRRMLEPIVDVNALTLEQLEDLGFAVDRFDYGQWKREQSVVRDEWGEPLRDGNELDSFNCQYSLVNPPSWL